MQEELYKTGAVNTQGQIVSGGQVVGQANPLDVPISSANLTPQTPLNVPNSPVSTEAEGLSGFTSSYAEQFKKQQSELAKATQEASVAKEGEKNTLKDIYNSITGIFESRPAEEQKAGLDVKAQKVTDVTNQIEALDRAEVNEQRALEGQGLTDTQKGQRSREISRRYAFQKADLALIQSAANRDYETAFNILERKTQLQLEPLKLKLDFQKLFYEENKDAFNKAEQREFDNLVKGTERQYNEEKATKDSVASLLMTALQNGVNVPARVIKELDSARSSAEATQILARNGISLQDPLDRENKLLTNQKLRADILASAGGSERNVDNIMAYASQFADTGKLPSPSELKLAGLSVGEVTNYARQMPKQEGALVSAKTGVKSSALSPAQEDGILALYDISKKTTELKELEDKRIKGLTSAAFGKIFGATDQENYLNLRTEIIDLLSRARTGAALTASEEKFYKDQLPGRVGTVGFVFGPNTQNKINNFESKINGTLKTRLQGQDLSIYGYSTVNVGGTERRVGELLDIGGTTYRVLPDGTLTDIF